MCYRSGLHREKRRSSRSASQVKMIPDSAMMVTPRKTVSV
jgi:hypothetical protein